jgi:hypothetical protein
MGKKMELPLEPLKRRPGTPFTVASEMEVFFSSSLAWSMVGITHSLPHSAVATSYFVPAMCVPMSWQVDCEPLAYR